MKIVLMFKTKYLIMRKIFSLGALLYILMMAYCHKASVSDNNSGPSSIRIKLAMTVTKATETAFESGDVVGVYMAYGNLVGSGNYLNNKRFSLSGTTWSADEDLYWRDQTTAADFYCYYPYAANVTDATKYVFSVKSDQSSEANYKASDFLWGKTTGVAPTESTVLITSAHKMSSLTVTLTPGDGFTADEFASAQKTVSITGVKTSAEINLASGAVSATGEAGSITPYTGAGDYRALVIPQTVSASAPFLTITVNRVPYNVSEAFTFASGTKHSVTAKVDKTSSGLRIGIENWTIDGTDYNFNAK